MRRNRERRPQGSRGAAPLLAASFLGVLALWAAWEAPTLPIGSFGLMLLAIALAVPAGLLARAWWYRTPFDITARLPRRLRVPARLRWRQRPFLGWGEDWLGRPRFAMGSHEDSVGIVGPTRTGKTSGITFTQALLWEGPLISVAPKPEVFRKTASRRLELAQLHGGNILIHAPTATGRVEGMVPIKFSPADSRDTNVVQLRVTSWMEAAQAAKNTENSDHWRQGAGTILRGTFLAAAHHPVRPGDFRLVRAWLASRDLSEPIELLRGVHSFDADSWAEDLAGIQEHRAPKERESFFSTAIGTIAATSNPAVLRSTMGSDIDPERFLLSRSTLYIVSAVEHQKAVAPLLAMLIESIVHTAWRLHREGRLPARLAVSLDDLANCAPLPQLSSMVSLGGGEGTNVMWSLQSLPQLRDAYGVEAAEAIWSGTRCRVIFGGLADEVSLERISNVIGEERIHNHGWSIDANGRRHRNTQESWRRLLSPAQLRRIPDRWAVLIYHNESIRMLREPLAEKCWQLAHAFQPWRLREPRRAAHLHTDVEEV